MPDTTAPVVLAFVACEKVLRDPKTNSMSLRNMLWRLYAPKLPATIKTLCGYASITGMRRPYSVLVRLVRVTTDTFEGEDLASSQELQANPAGPLEVIDIGLCMEDLRFEATGWYRLLLVVDGAIIAERKIELLELSPWPHTSSQS